MSPTTLFRARAPAKTWRRSRTLFPNDSATRSLHPLSFSGFVRSCWSCPTWLVTRTTGLISNLRKLGMSEFAYWLSTYLTASLLILASSLLALLAVPAFPESFQLYTWRPDVILSVYLVTGLHMTAVGLLIVGSLNSAYAANMLCGFLCMACIIVAAIFGFQDSIYLLGSDLSGSATAKAQALARASMWHSMFDPPVKGWLMSALLPFIPMGKVFTELSTYIDVGPQRTRGVVTWANAGVYVSRTFEEFDRVAKAKYKYTTVSTQATMLSTLGLVLATFALTAYINQVVGGPYPLWFPFTRGYWGLGQDGDAQVNAEAEREQALVVRNLKKSFTAGIIKRRTVKAVKDVSLTVRKGRVLALLGTNGAGKSTSISMITGLFRPDAGAVSVFGTANLAKIQQTIGVVTQSDITWPLLTAAEHVQLYAAFKNTVKCTPEYVTDRLTQVGLEGNADGQVGTFSGGMRKRLCVVLCSIGEPPLCILDEPTSSLDPINRLKVHKFIQTLKSHAAVILTTHLLDEADSLGDEICIIDDGQVKATGSSLALKSKYGSGYEVTLLTDGHVPLADMRDLVCAHAPEATLVQRSTDMFSATIPKSSTVTPLVRFLRSDDPKRVAMVQGWEISNETLEQVFLTVAEQAKAERDAAAGVNATDGASANDGDLQPFELPKFTPKKSLAHQIAAVMAKDWAFQMHQPKATIATFALVVLVLFGYVQLMDLARETVCPGGYAAVRKQSDGDPNGDTARTNFDETCDLSVPRQQFVKSAGACVPGLNLACVVGDFRLPSTYQGGSSTGARYWVQGDAAAADSLLSNTNPPLWSLVSLFGPGMNVSAPAIRKMAEDPVAVIKSNVQRMASAAQPASPQCKFRVSYNEEDKVYQGDTNVEPKVEFDGLLPDYAMKINSFSARSSDIHIVVPLLNYGTRHYLSIARPAANGSSCLVVTPTGYAPTAQQNLNQFLSQADPESISAISMSSIDGKLHELLQGTTIAQLRAVTRTNEGVFANLRTVPTVSAPRAIPALITFMMPMSFYVLFFSYLLLPFYEKEARLFEFYRVNGLSVAACWLGHYLFALSLTLPSLVASIVIVAIYIPTASIVSYLLLTLIAIHGSISMAFLLASILSSVTMARLISFLFPPVATVVSASLLITGDTPSFLASLLFPPLPYAHGLRSIVVTATPKWGLSLTGFAMSTVYLALAIALMTFTDKSPFAILKSKVAGLVRGGSGKGHTGGHSQQPLVDVEGSAADADDEDDEVRREREMLLAGGKETDGLAVKAVSLNKSFGSHQVLKNMNLAIAPGLTFGLLGANGCGKSTFLSIVMGSARPTSGNVWVGGKLSTTRDLSSVIGVCPQADLVIGDLTVEENLQFFARLRGASLWGQELDRLVSRCIELVGLKEARHRAAHALSGGMKRRLSMGIAVIGSPQLILADEPSSGLDAANKLGIWKLLGRIRESKTSSIIITTHFLQEADALCSRIGIMAGGRMRVLGNQLTLKSKFGSGYFVHMQVPVIVTEQTGQSLQHLALAAENAALDRIELQIAVHLGVDQQAVRVQHDHQEHLAEQRARGGILNAADMSRAWEIKVKVPLPSSSDLGAVFEFMASGQLGVVDWGVRQSSLEDVFVAVSTKYS
ncbi:hypothetical protein BCR44DRAFT_1043761 [Catenaria anguillulae PL171]|uniref:ABC transporter domain-containing protein n=1 Tax=Catenaria anguillulae PL171 TaxID=765915 RepID=A0A1Y2HRU7_9FUNG|nr:hypothetical protein BCR44DRAFT_1043761 [Catenaria anguillulae PL171]